MLGENFVIQLGLSEPELSYPLGFWIVYAGEVLIFSARFDSVAFLNETFEAFILDLVKSSIYKFYCN